MAAAEDDDDAAWAFEDGDAWALDAAAGDVPGRGPAVAAGTGPAAPVADSAVSRTGTLVSAARWRGRRLQAADASPFAADGWIS